MPANKYALLRYRIIDKMIGNKYKPYPSKEELRQACEDALYGSQGTNISISTIEKDLKAMREENELAYYAPIKYSKLDKGYYYEDPEYTINEIPLNDDDLDAIKFAATTLFQFKGISMFEQFENAIDKIFNRLNISTNAQDTTLNEFVQFDSEVNFKGKKYLQPILEGIKKNVACKISYQGFNKKAPSNSIIHPYLLKEYKNRWYLICFHPAKDKIITYALDRVKSFSLTADTYVINKNFNKEKYFKYCFGITRFDEAPSEVIIEFKPLQGKYVLSQKLHPSQKLLEQTEDKITIQLTVIPTYELVEQILSYGSNAKVLSPDNLKDRIVTELNNSLKNY